MVKIDKTGASDVTYYYCYNDQWQVVTEVKDGTVDSIYSWHPYYVDALLVRMWAVDQHYFLHDANFNVTATYNTQQGTPEFRTIEERYAYTPYGKVTVLDDDFSVDGDGISDIDNEYLFTGRRLDPETGLQINRNRYCHQRLGRWLTQ